MNENAEDVSKINKQSLSLSSDERHSQEMKNIVSLVVAVFAVCVCSWSCRQEVKTGYPQLDEYFESVADEFMGSVTVSQNGDIIYQKSVGYADIGAGVKAGPKSKYLIGSVSKTMTTVMAFRAIDAGLLSLDSTLESFFPEAGITNADKICIDDLLYHRSGMHDIFEHDDYYDWYTTYQSRDDILAKMDGVPADFEPGEGQAYCNAGFVLLSYILEDIYDKSFAELIASQIAKPAKLKDTYVPAALDHSKNECRSYKATDDGWVEDAETSLSFPLGAGSVISTPTDLVKFFNALFDGVYGEGIIDRMSGTWGALGRGLFPFFYYADHGVGHPGGIDSFITELCHFDRNDLVVAINTNGTSKDINEILAAVLNVFLPQESVQGQELELEQGEDQGQGQELEQREEQEDSAM